MQVQQLSSRSLGHSAAPARATESQDISPDDLFKPTPPSRPEAPEEPGGQGWGQTAAFSAAGLLAGGISGFCTGANMGGIWGGIVGGALTLLPAAALGVLAAIPLSESDAPTLVSAGLPIGIFGGGVAMGAYWGATGNLGGPIGLAVTGAITGGVLIGIWGFFHSERGYEKKMDAYYQKMEAYRSAEQRYESDKKEYDRELKAWAQRKDEKRSSSVIEDAKRLLVNGIQLKKRPPKSEKPNPTR